jgi:adenylate cyclase
VYGGGPGRETGFALLADVRETAQPERFTLTALPIVDAEIAREKARIGDVDGAIEASRPVVDGLFRTGQMVWRGSRRRHWSSRCCAAATTETLRKHSQRSTDCRAVPTDPGFVLHELALRLRALLARTRRRGDLPAVCEPLPKDGHRHRF